MGDSIRAIVVVSLMLFVAVTCARTCKYADNAESQQTLDKEAKELEIQLTKEKLKKLKE